MMLHNNQREVTGKKDYLFLFTCNFFFSFLSLLCVNRNKLEQKKFSKSYLYCVQGGSKSLTLGHAQHTPSPATEVPYVVLACPTSSPIKCHFLSKPSA